MSPYTRETMATTYRTLPDETDKMPRGIGYIVGNEAAERFSFYGMKTILAVFMTQYLLTASGEPAYLTKSESTEWVSLFVASAYFFPVIGALIADAILGKYLTIMLLSVVYCLGHLCLAFIDLPSSLLASTLEPKGWLIAGLVLVAIGSGGIKPCVSANVGDQFGAKNAHLLERVFGWFYFAINFGSLFSTLLTPWVLKNYGPGWAFGIPGILMALATVIFWMGRKKFVHVQPRGWAYLHETFGPTGLRAIFKLIPIYLFVAVFWSLYDQGGSSWVLQAQQMDCTFLGITWLESQIQAVNPLLILVFIPLFAYVVYPLASKVVTLTATRKLFCGFILTVVAFSISSYAQELIDAEEVRFETVARPIVESGQLDAEATIAEMDRHEMNAAAAHLGNAVKSGAALDTVVTPLVKAGIVISKDGTTSRAQWPSIAWQLLAYVILTAGEVLVSITCLEFSYSQSPKQMKSFVMSLFLLSVSAGNLFTALVNRFTMDASGNSTLVGASYYWFFTNTMAVATLLFIVVMVLYKPRNYVTENAGVASNS